MYVYSDGSGHEGHAAAAAHMMTRRQEPSRTSGCYLGSKAAAGDAERAGIPQGLQMTSDVDQVLILTNSQATMQAIFALVRSSRASRSQIEVDIKHALTARDKAQYDTGIAWIRAHIGIHGNELTDREASFKAI